MKNFMDKDFLLSNEISKKLYHDYSSNMPIIDYHCHINPQEIAEDKKFENIPDYKTIQSKISADYQTEYEKEYNQNLLQKANIKVNQPILDQLKAKYNKKNLN